MVWIGDRCLPKTWWERTGPENSFLSSGPEPLVLVLCPSWWEQLKLFDPQPTLNSENVVSLLFVIRSLAPKNAKKWSFWEIGNMLFQQNVKI